MLASIHTHLKARLTDSVFFDLSSIIGLSLALSVGLLLNILACALWKKWWPIFSGTLKRLFPFEEDAMVFS